MVTYKAQKQNLKLIDTYTTKERKEILGRSMEITTRVEKYIGPVDRQNTEPLTPSDMQRIETAIILVPEIIGVKYGFRAETKGGAT